MRRDHRHVYIDWEGTNRPRVDVIREMHASGVPVADIARRLGVLYQTVYMAVRAVHRSDTESVIARPPDQPGSVDAVLLGCVSQKQATPMAAKDLYRSELFRRRRLWAEASGKPWWIVSAEYGLVDPDEVIAPYDTRIAKPSARRPSTACRACRFAPGGAVGGPRWQDSRTSRWRGVLPGNRSRTPAAWREDRSASRGPSIWRAAPLVWGASRVDPRWSLLNPRGPRCPGEPDRRREGD